MAIPIPPSQADKHKRLEAMRLAVKLLAGCESTDMVFVLAEAIKDYLESGQRPSKKSPPPVPDSEIAKKFGGVSLVDSTPLEPEHQSAISRLGFKGGTRSD